MDFMKFLKIGKMRDHIKIKFPSKINIEFAYDKSFYFQKGPIVYSLNIPDNVKITKKYTIAGFYDYHHTAINNKYKIVKLNPSAADVTCIELQGSEENPWEKPLIALKVKMHDKDSLKEITLIPMGCTILRRVTFK